jgi:mycothiol synthase
MNIRWTTWISWVLPDIQREMLALRGFNIEENNVYLTRSPEDALPIPVLPPGFHLRHVGKTDVEARTRPSYGAFESTADFELYFNRYRKFTESEVYTPELDLITAVPDGRVGSFCICWMEKVNQVGSFEPVGTHPDFQRKGLGKAVMLEGLHRLEAKGMHTATVVTSETNTPAVRLYESIGFCITNCLCHHVRRW